MAGFLQELSVTPLPDGRYWSINRELEYCVGSADSTTKIIIPVGFKTDFASVPKILWPILPPTGKYTAATVVHDWLYRYPELTDYDEQGDESWCIPRYACDNIFNEAMTVLTVGSGTRRAMYSGVRVGGWKSWKTYRANDKTPL